MASLVKLRMAKLSIQWIGQQDNTPAASTRSTWILRANTFAYFCDLGPALRISSGTSNLAKFSWNFAANMAAC